MYILGWEEDRLFLIFTLEIVIAIVSIPLSDRIEDIESIIHKQYRGESTILHYLTHIQNPKTRSQM